MRCVLRPLQPGRQSPLAGRHGASGASPLADSRELRDESTLLRAERAGDDFTFSWSTDGQSWVEYARLSVSGITAKLEAGLAVVNAMNKEFSAHFDDLKLSAL